VDDVAELLELHEVVDLDGLGLAHAVHVVPREVDEHDVLRAVLLAPEQRAPELLVLGRRAPAADRARDRVVVHLARLDAAQRLRARADDLERAGVEEEHVRGRVHLPEPPVRVERVQVRAPREPLRRHRLDDVARDDVLLERGHERLVPGLPHVRHGRMPERDRPLRDLGRRRREERAREPARLGDRAVVRERERVAGGVGRAEDVRDDLDRLEEVVVHEQRVREHEERVGDPERVREVRAPRRGLEVVDGVVADEADRAAGEGRDLGQRHVRVLGELLLEQRHRVARVRLVRAARDDLVRIWAASGAGGKRNAGGGGPAPMKL
jgi:hypothetical protein